MKSAVGNMDAAPPPPPEQGEGMSSITRHHLPPEIIEEILSHLPLKSVIRFSSVSKSWNSMIFTQRFARNHKNCSAVLRRHSLIIYIRDSYELEGESSTFCSLSPTSPTGTGILFMTHKGYDPSESTVDATDFVGQLKRKPFSPHLHAFCDEILCVELGKSLLLWNPSMGNFTELSQPLHNKDRGYDFFYGLGYDSVGDDYKLLRVGRGPCKEKSELYSLKHNYWRKIESYPSAQPFISRQRCAFADGRLHWIGVTTAETPTPVIVSFNLSTEKYGEVALPQYSPALNCNFLEYDAKVKDDLEVVVMRGMLCACLNYPDTKRFVVWVMEEYGVEKSWMKKFDIHYKRHVPYFAPYDIFNKLPAVVLRAVNFEDNNEILITVRAFWSGYMKVFKYKNDEERPTEIAECGSYGYYEADAFLYVESLISPLLLGCNH